MAGTRAGGLLLIVVLASGCAVPRVTREDETRRFAQEMQRRAAASAIDAARPLSLDQCQRLALENSLDLQVRQLALRLSDQQVRLALAGGLPKASLRYDESMRSNNANVQLGNETAAFEDRHQQRLAVGVVAPVLDFGLTYYSYQIAQDQRRQERLLLERARQLLWRDVAVAYARHGGALRQERLARMAVEAARQVLKVARNLEREQMTVAADTSLIEAALAQAQLELSLAVQRIAETNLQLGQLMSLPPGTRFSIDPALSQRPLPTTRQVDQFAQCALRHRPELLVQDLQRQISASAVRREASAFFPRLDGSLSYNWSNNSFVVNPSFFQLGYSLAHSLLDGGATIWRYKLARGTATVEESRSMLIALGVVYELELRHLRLQQAYDTVVAARVLETSRRQALTRIVSLYNEGLEGEAATARSLADLTVQATVLDRAQTDYEVAWYELEAAAVCPGWPATAPATQTSTQPASQP